MKSAVSVVVLVLLAFVAGVLYDRQTAPSVKAIADSARTLDTTIRATDSLVAHHDTATAAEPERRGRAHLETAVFVGDTVARLQLVTDSAIKRAAVSDSARQDAMDALFAERAADRREVNEVKAALAAHDSVILVLRSQLSFYRDTALVQVTSERDRARQLLAESLKAPRSHRCGPSVTAGGGFGYRGATAGVFVGVGCVL